MMAYGPDDDLVPCGGTCPYRVQKFLIWHDRSYFSGFIPGFNDVMLLVIGDVLVDSEAPVVTL
jgi:hypothetical protein